MKKISRNKTEYKGLKHLIYSTKWTIEGLTYAYKNERSLWLHAIATVIAIILGFVLKINPTQWSIILITDAVILSIELINTAIEAVVDMVTFEYNDLAKIAKDCGSAATGVVSFVGIIIAIFIFGPKIIALFM